MILVLDPHGDDGVVSSGGMLVKHSDEDIVYIIFSLSRKSVPKGFQKDVIKSEATKALKVLGITKVKFLDYPVREFLTFRQDILEYLISLKIEYMPDIVYSPSRFDTHQDHKVICEEAIRAFKKSSSIYGYDMPWNAMNNHIHRFEVLNDEHIKKKMRAIRCFKSQLVKNNNVLSSENVKALAISRGSIVNKKYAEAFEVIREVIP